MNRFVYWPRQIELQKYAPDAELLCKDAKKYFILLYWDFDVEFHCINLFYFFFYFAFYSCLAVGLWCIS